MDLQNCPTYNLAPRSLYQQKRKSRGYLKGPSGCMTLFLFAGVEEPHRGQQLLPQRCVAGLRGCGGGRRPVFKWPDKILGATAVRGIPRVLPGDPRNDSRPVCKACVVDLRRFEAVAGFSRKKKH